MNETKRVNLALQGGGSHGAFTWGVLDALLEDERLMVEAVSGTSAGAMNAAILLQGWTVGGRAGARTALRAFWSELGTMSIASPIQRTPLDRLQGNWNLDDSPGALWADLIQRTLTPWQRNPLKFDPLRELLRRHFDEKTVRACREIKAFIAATNVQTGKARIFTREELSIDALLASACLPNVHDAVVIDGVPYWDGGFRGNPRIWPFIYESDSRDVVIVEVDPPAREGVPVERRNRRPAERDHLRRRADVGDARHRLRPGPHRPGRRHREVQPALEAAVHPFDRRSASLRRWARSARLRTSSRPLSNTCLGWAARPDRMAGQDVRAAWRREQHRHSRAIS